ncbi:MAG: hypothetical protein MRY83_21970 [Flavobacteriales bacterium]|nr:hypothetical protein [Flavobacteriales bacterium]
MSWSQLEKESTAPSATIKKSIFFISFGLVNNRATRGIVFETSLPGQEWIYRFDGDQCTDFCGFVYLPKELSLEQRVV